MGRSYKILITTMIIFVFIITSLTSIANNIELNQRTDLMTKFSADIIIPDDYNTIQAGIDNAEQGDTIFVRSGLYQENLVVETQGLSIIGENKFNTVIDAGRNSLDGINVSAPDVTISGFTFTNAVSENLIWDLSGLRIYASNITAADNRFINNVMGLTVMAGCYNATIYDNTFIGDGILLGQYQKQLSLSKKDFLHNINDNTVNGKTLYYMKNSEDFKVPLDVGQVIIANCSNVTVEDLYLSNTDFSVILAYCNNCVIQNITVLDTEGEVILFNSDYNLVQNNIMINNLHGICVDYQADYNIIRNNEVYNNYFGITAVTNCSHNQIINNIVEDNSMAGIYISAFFATNQNNNIIANNTVRNNKVGINLVKNSHNNKIENNLIQNSQIGIQLRQSDENTFNKNTFKKITLQTLLLNSKNNQWDNNYWTRPRILPKIIIGIPTINIDWDPAKQPHI